MLSNQGSDDSPTPIFTGPGHILGDRLIQGMHISGWDSWGPSENLSYHSIVQREGKKRNGEILNGQRVTGRARID